jgi:ammonium transporter, Amt family
MHYIPGLSLRCDDEAEIVGIDDYDMGEFAYDYVGLEQDLGVKDVEGGLERERVNATSGGREPRHHVVDADSSGGASEEKRAV